MKKNLIVVGVLMVLVGSFVLGSCGSNKGKSTISDAEKKERTEILQTVNDAIKETKKMIDDGSSFSYTSKRGEEIIVKDSASSEELASRKTNNQYIGTKDFENLKEEMSITNEESTKDGSKNKDFKETKFLKDGRKVDLEETDAGMYITWCKPTKDGITTTTAEDIYSVMLNELEEEWTNELEKLQIELELMEDDNKYISKLSRTESEGVTTVTYDRGFQSSDTPWSELTTLKIKNGIIIDCDYSSKRENTEEDGYYNRLRLDWLFHYKLEKDSLFYLTAEVDKIVESAEICTSYQQSYSFTISDINVAAYNVDYTLYNNAKAGAYGSSYIECRGW